MSLVAHHHHRVTICGLRWALEPFRREERARWRRGRAGLGASWRGPLAAAGWAPHPPPPPPSSPGSAAWAGPWGPTRGRATGREPMSELSKDQRGTPRGLGWALAVLPREREREISTCHERSGRTSPKRAGAALSLHHQGRPCGSPVLRSGALSWHLPHPLASDQGRHRDCRLGWALGPFSLASPAPSLSFISAPPQSWSAF